MKNATDIVIFCALFTHRDEVEQAWGWIDPIVDVWEAQRLPPQNYPAGSWGPEAAQAWFENE